MLMCKAISVVGRLLVAGPIAVIVLSTPTIAQTASTTARPTIPTASAEEPIAAKFSGGRAVGFLDRTAVDWTRKNHCGACHTNYAYMMAKPLLMAKGEADENMSLVRRFFEDRVRHWDDPEKAAKPRWDAEVVSTASILAMNDQMTTGKLQELTKRALDRMWALQKPNGSWNWLKAKLPPYEYDDYYGAIVAALGVGYAPGEYASSESAKKGVESLRRYFRTNPPPNLHHEAMLLWASTRLEGLMTNQERTQTIQKLRALQKQDGGWCLPSLGIWNRRDGTLNDPHSPSDGFATGLVIYVLRQSGVAKTDPAIEKGIAWLKTHQRESGRWFTRSLNHDNKHYISNAGTAFAVMALDSCDEIDSSAHIGAR